MTEDIELRGMLQAAPDATAIVDSAGRIVTMNELFGHLFRYERGELIGLPIENLVPERFRSGHPGHRAEYAADSRSRPMGIGRDLYALRQDGAEFAAEISLSSLATPTGPMVCVAVRDVSERRQVEDRLRQFVEAAPDAVVIAEPDGT